MLRKHAWIVPVLAVSLTASTAFAALGIDQQKCQKRVGSVGGAFFKRVAAALQKCHNDVGSGKLPPNTDCSTEASTAAKIARYEATLNQQITRLCPSAVV